MSRKSCKLCFDSGLCSQYHAGGADTSESTKQEQRGKEHRGKLGKEESLSLSVCLSKKMAQRQLSIERGQESWSGSLLWPFSGTIHYISIKSFLGSVFFSPREPYGENQLRVDRRNRIATHGMLEAKRPNVLPAEKQNVTNFGSSVPESFFF